MRTPFFAPHSTHSLPQALSRVLSGSSSPHGYLRPSDPRAANSHSASVGKRLPWYAQYLEDMDQSTQLMGCCIFSGLPSLHNTLNTFLSRGAMSFHDTTVGALSHPPALTQASYSATVTS